jgi:hypothetical protein
VTTLTVTPLQAWHLAHLLQQSQQAKAAADAALALLTLGHPVPHDATLADVNVDTGVLTFHVEQPVALTEGD